MDRVQRIAAHVSRSADLSTLEVQPTAGMSAPERSDDDVVICSALRTPVGKARRGNLKDTPTEDMLAPLFKATLERTKLDPKAIGDIQIGNVGQAGAGGITSRIGQFLGGVPFEVPILSVNRQCSSGLQAVANVAEAIKAGTIDVGIAGGVESMSFVPMGAPDMSKMSMAIGENEGAASCLTPMGITSENVAEKWGISRETQDKLAVESHKKAIAAQKAGHFKDEIVAVKTKVKDAQGKVTEVEVSADEGPRGDTTLEGLSKLKPAFKEGGSTTAGNSSQTSDGAAMVLLARRSTAKQLGLPVLARMRSYAVVGVDPKFMGIGPAFAIPEALKKANLTVSDIDIFEINEAFASQATMSVDHLGIPMAKVNPKGGAIALGHPLGCTGSRQIATLLPEMKRTNSKLGVVSMCIGTGMGAAGVFESEQ